MFRGFRWQLIALLIALFLCAAAAVFRISRQSMPTATATVSPQLLATDLNESPAPTATALPVIVGRATPESENAAATAATAYREGLVGSVQRINPLFAHLNPPDRDLSSLIFEGLFAVNDYGEAVPRLAAELMISSDGLEYVVRLRDDIMWQDGIRFTADDVVYTLSLLGASEYADFSAAAAFWGTVETQKLSADLVRLRLVQPFSSFPVLLTIGILPEHALRGTSVSALASHPFNLSPIGTGAYQLTALHSASDGGINAAHLQLSPTHRRRQDAQAGYLFRDLIFRLYDSEADVMAAYESGEIDALAIEAAPDRLLSLPNSRHFRQARSELGMLVFNWSVTPFEERRVRQGLALSLDLPRLMQTHFGTAAVFADSPYILGSSVYQPSSFWHTYDLERATTLLAALEPASSAPAAGDSDDDEAGTPYKLLVADSVHLRGLAEDIAAAWRQLGFNFAVESADAITFAERLEAGDFDAAILAQRIGADRDLFRFWHPAQHGGGSNYGAAAHNEIAELIELARAEIYAGRRALLYQKLQDVFATQALAIPLYYPLLTYITRDSIEGVKLGFLTSPADRFRGIQQWRPATLAG